MTEIRLGTQRWDFRSWIGSFYSGDTCLSDTLASYSRTFPTVEVGSSFFGVPTPVVVSEWLGQVPEDFVFSFKVPAEITHVRRLAETRAVLRKFVARLDELGPARGPLLLQLPLGYRPSHAHWSDVEYFISHLPFGPRWVVELRYVDWLTERMLTLLRDHNVALSLLESRWVKHATMLDLAADPTADFVYVRWMGDGSVIGDFSQVRLDRSKVLGAWAEVLKRHGSLDLYGYFNNRFEGHAPRSVRTMHGLLGAIPVETGAEASRAPT